MDWTLITGQALLQPMSTKMNNKQINPWQVLPSAREKTEAGLEQQAVLFYVGYEKWPSQQPGETGGILAISLILIS